MQADETRIQVLSSKGKLSPSNAYMRGYQTAGVLKNKLIYDYHPSRSASEIKDFLEGVTGYLQSDAYSGCARMSKDSKSKIYNVFCWAHARHKFADIVKTVPNAFVSEEALTKIEKLYGVEKEARDNLPPDKIKELGQEKARPLLDKLHQCLKTEKRKTPPKSLLGKAIKYSLSHWSELTRYLEDGRLEIDNNGEDRRIKDFVIG